MAGRVGEWWVVKKRVYVAKSSLEGVWVLAIMDVRVGLDNVEMIIWPVVANAHVVLVMPCAMNSW